jgi:hypothetical protein
MKRGETTDISNREVDTPIDESSEEGGVVVEDGEVCERLIKIVRGRNDFMEIGSLLKTTECIYQASFDWVLSLSGAATPSL